MAELVDADVIPGWFRPPWYAEDWEELADIEYAAVWEALQREHPTTSGTLEERLFTQVMAYDAELRFRICHRTWDRGDTWRRIQLRIRRLEGRRVERDGFDYASDDSELSVSEESDCSLNSMEELFQRLCVETLLGQNPSGTSNAAANEADASVRDDNAFAE